MCGRYTLKNKDAVKELYGIDIKPNYNVAPSSEVIVLSSGPNIMKWSYSPSWAKKPMNIINARIETLNEKPSFRESKRCVFLTDGWYEWKRWFDWERRENKKVPYYHMNKNKIIHIAGIYNDNGCAVITEEADSKFKEIHHRKPVLLDDNEIKVWLEGDIVRNSMLSKDIEIFRVSSYVNSVKNNDIKCIEQA